jgi:hypothetical protein
MDPATERHHFVDKAGLIKAEILITPNEQVSGPFLISLDFDNPVLDIAQTVANLGAVMGGGPFSVGNHASIIVINSIGPAHPLVVAAWSLRLQHFRGRDGEGRDGNVVLLSEGLGGGGNLLGGLSADAERTIEAEEFAGGGLGLDDAVGHQGNAVAGVQFETGLLVLCLRGAAKGQARIQFRALRPIGLKLVPSARRLL